jgi:hypothetical protein
VRRSSHRAVAVCRLAGAGSVQSWRRTRTEILAPGFARSRGGPSNDLSRQGMADWMVSLDSRLAGPVGRREGGCTAAQRRSCDVRNLYPKICCCKEI